MSLTWHSRVQYILCLWNLYSVCVCVYPYAHLAQGDWNGTQRAPAGGKAPAQRQTKGAYREHPYGRY